MLRRTASLAFTLVLIGGPSLASAQSARDCIDAHETGLAREGKTRFTEAREAFEDCGASACPEAIRQECQARLAIVLEAQPTIVLAVTRADGADVTEGRVSVDGAELSHGLDGRPLTLDPGNHRITVRTDQGEGFVDVVIRQGQKDRTVPIVLPDDEKSALPAPPLVHPAAWAAGGVGLAGLAVFAVFGSLGLEQESEVDACRPNCSERTVSRMRELYLVGDIGLLTGAAGIVGAVVLGITLAPSDDVEIEAGLNGASFTWRF